MIVCAHRMVAGVQSREGTRDAEGVVSNRAVGVALFVIGVAFGLSQLVAGVYNEVAWSMVALGALGVALALAVSGLAPRPPLTLLLPLLGLWLWSLISSGWSESTDASHTAANRWLLYAATVAVLGWVLAADRRRAIMPLTGAAAGVFGVTIWMLARMLGGHGPELFLGTRLNDPLGYVNGQAAYLLIATWPALSLAERRHSAAAPALAGLGMCAVVCLTGVGLMTQSRSWGVALAAGIVVTLAAVPGRPRRGAAMMLAAAAIAAIFSPLSHVWHDPNRLGVSTVATTRHGAGLILIVAVVAGLIWGAAVEVLDRLAPGGTRRRTVAGRLTGAALGAIVLVAVAVLIASASSISHRIRTQYDAFVHLAPTSSGGARLFSGGGDRYDYWRVALKEFSSSPIDGVGAGNYDPGYYLHRRTTEAITQPHSIELQTLAELGIVGAVLLAAFLLVVIVGFVRTARAATYGGPARRVAVAAGGAFTVWWIQTSVDWMHLIPGLTAIALAASVALVARSRTREDRAPPAIRGRLIAIALAVAVTVVGIVTLVPRVISLQAQNSAEHALGHNLPLDAIRYASTALEYDPNSVSAYELRSAGLARLDDFPDAYADLERALRAEPKNWTTWALLGDLLTRHGNYAAARSAYARAHVLNPLESGLLAKS